MPYPKVSVIDLVKNLTAIFLQRKDETYLIGTIQIPSTIGDGIWSTELTYRMMKVVPFKGWRIRTHLEGDGNCYLCLISDKDPTPDTRERW